MTHARPSSQPDLLAGATLSSLTRPIYFPLSWGVLPSLLGAVLTLGFLPIFLIPRWLRAVVAQHQQQAQHLAEWLRLHTGSHSTAELQSAANELRFRPAWVRLGHCCALIAVLVVAYHFRSTPISIRSAFEFWFGWDRSPHSIAFSLAMVGANCSMANLIIAHYAAFRRYTQAFDRFAAEQNLLELQTRENLLSIGYTWWIPVLALFIVPAWWSAPALLAMGIHRRYTMVTSVRLRAQLAERMRILLDRETPPLTVPRHPVTVLRTCIRPICRAPLTFAAAFCPRCGTRIARSVDVVG